MVLVIRTLDGTPVDEAPAEVVERKGLGHPDTICDAVAEEACHALCRAYLERFGRILHHNVDKVLLVGGSAEPAFGGGRVVEPIEIILAGRAVCKVGDECLPVVDLAVEAARSWLRRHLHALDVERHVRVTARLRRGSADLVDLYDRRAGAGAAPANDTSCGVGFAPATRLERAVRAVEARLQEVSRRDHPELGEDVKVMGMRIGGTIRLTVACAMVGRALSGMGDYLAAKEAVAALACDAARVAAGTCIEVEVNAADDPARGSVYLTVTGTSAEAGDDGEAGRGNRGNGIITPYRPMSLESVAGKNPVSHVGKVYSRGAQKLCDALVRELPEVVEATCHLVSRIGHAIDDPELVDVRVRLAKPETLDSLRPRIEEEVGTALRHLGELWRDELRPPDGEGRASDSPACGT